MNEDNKITFNDFAKIDIRLGKVLKAEEVEGSEKLIRLTVNFGELGERIIFAGIKLWYKPEDLVEKTLPFVVNMAPKKMPGGESNGMLVAAGSDEAVLLLPDKEIAEGTKVH